MWTHVIQTLEEKNQLGTALPIACSIHPENVSWINDPAHLSLASPDGGCTLPCDVTLPCGHLCGFLVSLF